MPFCRASLNLELGSNSFVEIENELPGTSQYNQLIKLYSRKNWTDLKAGLSAFKAEFETSPLVEAVDFLELESQIEQLPKDDEANLKKAENRFRELLVLYPRSTLAPILAGTVAYFHLSQGNYAKALSLYKSSRELFPFHGSNCVFLLGEAGANYGIGNTEEAMRGFKTVAQKCPSGRLQLGAQVRLIDIERDQTKEPTQTIQKYEKLINQNPTVIPRIYPEALLNLGELKYRSKNFPSAGFYFQDYYRNSGEMHSCQPLYLKRLADLSLQQNKTTGEIVGNYLSVYEKYPKTEIGKFSRAIAYLIELPSVSDQESERRLEAINFEVQSLRDRDFKAFLEINRGLALLDRGEDAGLDALARSRNRFENLFKTDLEPYIRKKLLGIYKERVRHLEGIPDRAHDKILLEPLEETYPTWFKATPDEKVAKNLYQKLIQTRFRESLSGNSPKRALQKLERWKSSPLFQPDFLNSKLKTELSAELAGWWLKQKEKNPQGIASELLEKSKDFEGLLKPEGEALWFQAYQDLQKPSQRNLSSLPKPGNPPPPLAILMARAYRDSKQFSLSKSVLQKVVSAEWLPFKTIELMKTMIKSGESQDALTLGKRDVGKGSPDYQKEVLNLLKESVLKGKQWKASGSVLKLATHLKLPEKDLASFYFMDGRAFFEKGEYLNSKKQFEKSLISDPESELAAEAQFQLGHCLYRLQDREGAKKQWEQVAGLNNEFWSPLAKN